MARGKICPMYSRTSSGGVEKSPARRKREAARRRRQDEATAAKNSAVTTGYRCICATNPDACRATEHSPDDVRAIGELEDKIDRQNNSAE